MITDMTSATITSAGLAIGIALLVTEHVKWWRTAPAGGPGGKKGAPSEPAGKARDPQALLPFWSGIAFGTLMVACPAGLLGTAAGVLRWGGNGIGGGLMSLFTGQHASPLATASAPHLDQYGALVVTALCVALWLLRKAFSKMIKGKFKRGVCAGVLVGIGSGVFALVGNTVVPGANSAGAWLFDGLVHSNLGSLL